MQCITMALSVLRGFVLCAHIFLLNLQGGGEGTVENSLANFKCIHTT